MPDRTRTLIFTSVVLIGLSYTYYLCWVAEDAYISFRYARNLVEGHGLVFNPGERVEGYTNFLWTILLSAGLAVEMAPKLISLTLGLICTAISYIFLFQIHNQLIGKASIPFFLVALGTNYTWACFSTSGLETSLLSALLAASFYFVAKETESSNQAINWSYAILGLLQTMAIMTRPDAVLACAVITIYITIRAVRHNKMKSLVWLFLPFLLFYAPYFLWRYNYYGYLFPNTFYAKAASQPYYKQGLTYVWEFIQRYSLWVFLFLFIFIAFSQNKLHVLKNKFFLVISTFCLIHIFYVVRLGGDFMEGRFLIPVLPWIYLILEFLMRAFLQSRLVLASAFVLLVATSAIDRPMIEPRTITNQISDERTWVPLFELWYKEGAVLGNNLPKDTVVATDAVGAFGYASRLEIIDTLGLTDATVAHLPVKLRTRPGHEKIAPIEYLKRRNVSLIRDGMGIYRSSFPTDWTLANNRYHLLTEDPAVKVAFNKSKAQILRK